MARNDGGKPSCLRVEVESREFVKHIQMKWAHYDNFRCRQFLTPSASIDVPTDGKNRRDVAKSLEHFRIADITSVEYELGTSQSLNRLRPNKAMGI
jgi:hypothetical protein